MHLASPYYNTHRNITVDSFYTSVPLAMALYNKGLTLVGTVNNKRNHLPENLKEVRGRQLYSTLFAMSKKPTSGDNVPIMLASYVSKLKPPKNVILLSTMHSKFEIPQTFNCKPNPKKKPQVIKFYNSTMGAVDTDDQMVRRFSCKRSTVRWTMSWFYSIIDICVLNAFILYSIKDDNTAQALKKRRHSIRMNIYKKLAMDLIRPHSIRRYQNNPSLSLLIKESIIKCFPEVQQSPPQPQQGMRPGDRVRKGCSRCQKEEVKPVPKVSKVCNMCGKYLCKNHYEEQIVCSGGCQ